MKEIDNIQFLLAIFLIMSYNFNIPHVQLESNQPGFNLLHWCMQTTLNDVHVWYVDPILCGGGILVIHILRKS